MDKTGPQERYAFPLSTPSAPLERWLRTTLGRTVLALRGGLRAELLAGAQPRTGLERTALLALVAELERRGDTEAIARLQRAYWAASEVVHYHDLVDERFTGTFLVHHVDVVNALLAAAKTANVSTLIEIGCGSGRVLEHIATLAPELQELIGMDLSPAQVERNNARSTDQRVRYLAGDAVEHIHAMAAPGQAFFSYGGVLEYIPQARLAAMLRHIQQRSPAVFGLVEPLVEGFDPKRAGPSQHYGAERSLSHPYHALLTAAGFTVVHERDSDLNGMRMYELVAVAQG